VEKIDQIVEDLSNMPVIQLIELTKKLEDKWGVKANQVMMPQQATTQVEGPVEEQTEFDVKLTSVGGSKVQVIKAIREITNLGLKESKELSEILGTLAVGVDKAKAEEIRYKIREAGGEAAIQ